MSASHDVIVVGSGAGGGMAAYELTHAGVRVLMLEAGRDYDPITETPMFTKASEAPLRGSSTPDKPFGYFDATVNGGWEVPGEPYTVAEGSKFQWWRARMLGGRTNHWGRFSFRFGSDDFRPHSRDGLGVDWPIGYEDVAPYYDRVESLIGVFGSNEPIANQSASSPGVLLPPPAPRAYELFVKAGCSSLGIPCVPMHAAVLTRPLNGRPACFYATGCERGCAIRANFQSTTVLLPPARATGKLEIRTNAMVYEVTLDKAGKANGVRYIDTKTGQHRHATARAVVLAASACESARILLNSTSASFPQGLANSSGHVGRNLTDSTGVGMLAQFPALEGRPAYNEEGTSLPHLYIPWWLHEEQKAGKLDFPRGYHIEFDGGRTHQPEMWLGSMGELIGNEYGAALKARMRSTYGSILSFAARGEMVLSPDCYCDIDPKVKDRHGIPVLRFHWKWSDHERRQARHFTKTMRALVDRLGGTVLSAPADDDADAGLAVGGEIIHEVGTTRMGSNARDSVVNGFGQSWDVKNLFVMDGGVFASNPDKNATLTILTLAMRSTDYLINELKRRSL
jgi:choline dehydrogenase-like flavoprotein